MPVSVTVEGRKDSVGPTGAAAAVRLTLPVKPLRPGAIVIVETAEKPALTVSTLGLATTEKSCFVNVTVTLCDNEPLDPVTVAEKVPTEEGVHVRVDVPEPTTLVGLRVHVNPAAGVDVRETVLEKPFTGLMVMVEEPDVPLLIGTLVGNAVIAKSCVAKVTLAV